MVAIGAELNAGIQKSAEDDALTDKQTNIQLENLSNNILENESDLSIRSQAGKSSIVNKGVILHDEVNKGSSTVAVDKDEKHEQGAPGYGGSESVQSDSGSPGLTAQLGSYGIRGFEAEVKEFINIIKPSSK
jgi:hypothetical protein